MQSPSPQILRALRISIPKPLSRSQPTTSLYPSLSTLTSVSQPSQPRRYNSNISRPSRITPRAHPHKPTSRDRGPVSREETQTDLSSLNVLASAPAPATSIDTCLATGFQFNNGVNVTNGDGVLLVNGEAFAWRPWLGSSTSGSGPGGQGQGQAQTKKMKAGMVNKKGQFEVDQTVWGLLDLVWPRPGRFRFFSVVFWFGMLIDLTTDLLIVGTGSSIIPLSLETKRHINTHGIRVEVLDTRNAAAQFNLLATERGVSEVAAALIPIGWEGR